MTTKGAQDTDRKDSRDDGHPSASDEMTRMMADCGCGPMMAKMMAACMGAGGTDDAANENGTKEEGGEPQSTE